MEKCRSLSENVVDCWRLLANVGGCRNLLKTIAPLYEIQGRKKMTQILDEKYDVLSSVLKDKIKNVSNITLTTDIWTNSSLLFAKIIFIISYLRPTTE